MDGLRFYTLFNNISVILEQCNGGGGVKWGWGGGGGGGDNKGCLKWNLTGFSPRAEIKKIETRKTKGTLNLK